MATFKIPNDQKQIRQLNRYENAGEIVESFNLDLFKKLGKIHSSKKFLKILDESDVGNDILYTLASYEGDYYLATNETVYSCPISTAIDPRNAGEWDATSILTTGAGIGEESDSVVFDGKLLITTATDIISWDGSVDLQDWWTNTVSGTALTANYPHIAHVHRGGQETLFLTDKNLVRYYNAAAGHSTVTLDKSLVACCVASGISAIWVGTYTDDLENAYVYEIYVGEQLNSVPVARNAYKIDAKAVLSIETINNIPYIVTEKGDIRAFDGSGFSTVASFPFAGTDVIFSQTEPGNINDRSDLRLVHPKGMKQKGDSLLIAVNTKTVSDEYPEHSPSGVWQYEPSTKQLTHKYSIADDDTHAGTSILFRAGTLLVTDNQFVDCLLIAEPDLTRISGLYGISDATPQSHFVTIEIESDSIQDAYESVYQKAKTLVGNESIELKFRLQKRDKIFGGGTYLTTKVINTTNNVTGIEVGDEFTDTYTGLIAHIVSIDTNVSVTSIELDREIGTAGQTRGFEIQNFKPIGYDVLSGEYNVENRVNYTSVDKEYRRDGGFEAGTFCQFKVVFYGDIEYRQFLAKTNSKSET